MTNSWRWLAGILIGLGGASLLWPGFAQWSVTQAMDPIERIIGVRGRVENWHIDPLHHALIIDQISLEDAQGQVFGASQIKVQLQGFAERFELKPRYAIEIMNPVLRLTQSADGSFRLGAIRLPPEPSSNQHRLLPRSVSIKDGTVLLMSDASPPLALTEIRTFHGELEQDVEGWFSHKLSWKDAKGGMYSLTLQRQNVASTLEITLDLESAHLAPWTDLLPDSSNWRPLSGELSGHLFLALNPGETSPYQMTLRDFKAEDLHLVRQGELTSELTIEYIKALDLSIEPTRHHYRTKALEINQVTAPHFHVDRISAVAFDSESVTPPEEQEPIRLQGLTHDLTKIAELTLEGLHPRDQNDLFRLDLMRIRDINGPRVASAFIDLKDLSFDPHAGLIRATSARSDEISGAFGTLAHIQAEGPALSLQDDRLLIDRLVFGHGHTKTFTTAGGDASGIEWDRLGHTIKVAHARLEHSTNTPLHMVQIDADDATFETLTKRLKILRMTGHQGMIQDMIPSSKPVLAIPMVTFFGLQTDPEAAHWGADQVFVSQAAMQWIIHPDNHFEIKGLTSGFGKPANMSDPQALQKHWTYDIGAVHLTKSEAHLTDLGTMPPTQIKLKDLELSADDLDTRANDDSDITAHAHIGSRGSIDISGRMRRNPLSAAIRIDLQNFRLPLLAPYWNAVTRLSLKRGYANLNGELRIIPGEHHHIEFEGDGHLDDLETQDPISGRRILCVKKLTLDDVAISSAPKRFYTRVMDWEQAYLHLVLKADHHLNLTELFDREDAPYVPSEIKDMHIDPSPNNEPPHAAIGLVRFNGSRVDYSDLSLKPQLSTSVRELRGTVQGLSSRRDATADISLSGKINRNSPVRLSGDLEPMDHQDHTDLKLDFTGLNMTSFPQYAGRFSGYRVVRGKLNLDLHYKIDQSIINIDNRATIDRLTLGEKIEEAHHVLVDIALWMLKDNHGNLDIDLPIYGDLENPSYDLTTLYGQALVQFFGKIFTTPATLVEDLIPTAHAAQSIAFDPGQREVNGTLLGGLAGVVAEFKNQEGGVIEITPTANSKTDGAALAADALKLELKEAYIHEQRMAGKPVKSREDTHLSDQDMQRQFKRYFHEHHPDVAQSLQLAEPDEAADSTDMDTAWKHALEEWHTSPDLVHDLAEDRAESIRHRLIHDYNIDEGSIYLRQAEFLSEGAPIAIKVEYFSD